jgi:thiol-disulfide isomerase/thioredoxin
VCGILLLAAVSAQAQRPVVIEDFTGTWCGYCYAASVALDRIEEERPRDEVIVIAYHRFDSFEISPICADRVISYSVGGYPTVWFNGMLELVGGYPVVDGEAGISIMKSLYESHILAEETRTAGTEPFQLTLLGDVGPTDPEMRLIVDSPTGYPNPVSALFLITENGIPVTASNGQTVLNAVVRAHLGTEPITLTSPGSVTVSASLSGTIPHLSPNALHPAVILQDDTTGEIVGAAGILAVTACRGSWTCYR